jgi:long-subunit acyl-CoA synthetase (AMP-forming)
VLRNGVESLLVVQQQYSKLNGAMAINNTNKSHAKRPSIIRGPSEPQLLEWTFNDLLIERCRYQPDNVALICPQQKVQCTYAQLQNRSRRVAAGLHNLGVKRGDRVGILLGNRIEYVEVRQAYPLVTAKLYECLPVTMYTTSIIEERQASKQLSLTRQ